MTFAQPSLRRNCDADGIPLPCVNFLDRLKHSIRDMSIQTCYIRKVLRPDILLLDKHRPVKGIVSLDSLIQIFNSRG